MFGTMGYAAPEALGYYDEGDGTITYTMSVDIWAVGTIALTLLLGREVFPRQGDLSRYVNGQRSLDFSRAQGDDLSDTCQDFVKKMLAPDPVARPTVISALAHPWLNQPDTPQPPEVEMNDAQNLADGVPPAPPGAPRIKPEPEPDWGPKTFPPQIGQQAQAVAVKQEETKPELKLYPPRDPIVLERIHRHLALDTSLLWPKFRSVLTDKVFFLAYSLFPPINTQALSGSC